MEYNGIKFYKRSDSGYWYASGQNNGLALHRYVWETHNGCKIPDGYEIHHKDEDKDNNEPINLALMTERDHRILHNKGGARHTTPHTDEARNKIKEARAKQVMPTWNEDRRKRFMETTKTSEAYKNRTHPIKVPTTPEMLDDVKNGMTQRQFVAKYKLSNHIWNRVRKDLLVTNLI